MQNSLNNKQKSPERRFLFILGAALFIGIAIIGLMIMFWKQLHLPITQTQRYTFGAFFIVYGILRFIRVVRTKIYEE
ncbi:hypothetical protein HH214_05135 [Mucilaginibacter robiniae]|uniref:Uncharacterized protein n=1 Tax=Mucilaginibacter robiniae TaxID=2728022 RepID=A0A7L5DZ36_9SPHI|nr:hypothetical protein [Mucilaginibacter robiniae]QJD95299.1 hypothetical protein HH214_05135 [Mucilaginibacter robiniae]